MKDIMIDLETLGTGADCVVVSLGASYFDIETNNLGPKFYVALQLQEQMDKGRVVDASTISWWMSQGEAAKYVFKESPAAVEQALVLFALWYKYFDSEPYVWGNGATFDISILESLFKTYGIACPWSYNKAMDVRTYKRFIGKGASIAKTGVAHNALDDAVDQALYVMEHYNANK